VVTLSVNVLIFRYYSTTVIYARKFYRETVQWNEGKAGSSNKPFFWCAMDFIDEAWKWIEIAFFSPNLPNPPTSSVYFKTFYGRICCCIVISWSVFHFHSSLVGKARSLPLEGSPMRGSTLVGFSLTNIRVGWKWIEGENTLAYHSMAIIMAMKSFTLLASGALAQYYKNFTAAIYEN
jgi:hypothetical protein